MVSGGSPEGLGIMLCWTLGIIEFGVLESWSLGVLESWNLGVILGILRATAGARPQDPPIP